MKLFRSVFPHPTAIVRSNEWMPETSIVSVPHLGPLGFGAANLGNLYTSMSDDQAWALIDTAWECGIRYFDTAPHYGLGLSERRLGAFLQTKPRGEFVVSTKVGRLIRPNPRPTARDTEGFDVPGDLVREWDFSPDGVGRSLDESLQRLGLDRVDILYLHDPERYDQQRGLADGLPALAALRDEGVVGAIGVGSMVTETLHDAAESGVVDLLMVAGRYTLADQPTVPDVIDACVRNDVGIVNASVFNSGLLATDQPETITRFDYGDAPDGLLDRVIRIRDICRELGVELPTAALLFAARGPQNRTVVIAGSRPEQIVENAERMRATVPEPLWTTLAANGLIPVESTSARR
jgi:D-threo-aldose 1-dehydrogenase